MLGSNDGSTQQRPCPPAAARGLACNYFKRGELESEVMRARARVTMPARRTVGTLPNHDEEEWRERDARLAVVWRFDERAVIRARVASL
jgi:hypothetical protein